MNILKKTKNKIPSQKSLFIKESTSKNKRSKRPGPPNRMNDLPYREWMKFQKSFFWYDSSQSLIIESINFFTKAVWPNGETSRSLIIGVKEFDAKLIPDPRIVDTIKTSSLDGVLESLKYRVNLKQKYDYILIDFRNIIADCQNLSIFLEKYSDNIYKVLRKLLNEEKYCTILVNMVDSGGTEFPIPWSVALACRDYLRLRDEKIGLIENKNTTVYYLVMQSINDKKFATFLKPENLHLTESSIKFPSWIIPKPPPRKKHEILHPAKFPETLVSEFIELFTSPGDNVFDPMVGTGSTVLAAIRTDRNGYGIDLSDEYVRIAKHRVIEEYSHTYKDSNSSKQASLFPDIELEKPIQLSLFAKDKPERKAIIICGDSAELKDVPEIKKIKFNYICTSPPYWSMLLNPGSEGQRARRKKNLPLVYSENPRDLANIQDYDDFIQSLEDIYNQIAEKLSDFGHMTVIIKNIKREHIIYPLAWNLVERLCGNNGRFNYIGTTLWCQDDIGLKPFAVGIVWVSNTLHHYCLHFQKRR